MLDTLKSDTHNARMPDHIVIERLEFRGRCGVTPEERAKPQPLAVDLELNCQIGPAGRSDNLGQTIDYAAVAQRIVEIGTTQDACLLETLADRFVCMLFAEFPVEGVTLWVRKLHPPISQVTASIGVSLTRTTLQHQQEQNASAPFLVQQLHRLPKGRALDVAAGSGRHALFLAAHGYQVDALDRNSAALAQLSQSAAARRLSSITTRTVDLEQPKPFDPAFGHETYDVIVVFFYLHRPLFPFLIEALKPGGLMVYETFSIDNHLRHGHPRRQEFCLTRNELLRLTSPLQVLHYDEGPHDGVHGSGSTYTAQLIAQKPPGSTIPT